MNFSCMACHQCRRPDSTPKLSPRPSSVGRAPSFSVWLGRIERTWSGSLAQRVADAEKGRKAGKLRSPEGHGGWITTPRLVRCCGIKRDWSLEDPRKAVGGLQKYRT